MQERTAFILVTDIYRSTQLWERHRGEFKTALERHNNLVERVVHDHGGEVMKNLGDGYIAIFTHAKDCFSSGVEVQKRIGAFDPLSDGTKLKVRVVAHGGTLVPLAAGKGYFGQPLNRASRICQVCHPGQMLVSEAVKSFIGIPPSPLKLFDLGVHRLRDLAEPEHIYQVDHPEFETHTFDPLPTLVGYRPNNLVVQPNAFIGREKELSELTALIVSAGKRLVTITASGGYGKSRLAMQLCANLLDNYANGVFAVMLAPVADHTRVLTAAADALGFQFYGKEEPADQFTDYLREKEMLIHFDNFEHVLDARELVSAILAKAPKVSMIVTSREPLRIQGESLYKLKALPTNREDRQETGISDSAALFLDRAILVHRDIEISPQSLDLVNDICSRLDGVPLAIELAAAWADSFTLRELLSELSGQVELTARMTDVAPRHRSIRASLDWSYKMLSDEQREILSAVSVFKGGFFLDAGQAVTGAKGLRIKLAGLCDKGWLFTKEVKAQTRFFVRDAAAREYALEKLRESDGWNKTAIAHSRHYAGLVEREGPRLEGHGQIEATGTLTVELENIFEALDTALHLDKEELMLPLAAYLAPYCGIVSEWLIFLHWYERILEAGVRTGSDIVKLKALLGSGAFLRRLGRYGEAKSKLEEARVLAERLGDLKALAHSIRFLGNVARSQGRFGEAENLYTESLAISREIGSLFEIASNLNNLGAVAHSQGRYGHAEKRYKESLTIRREIGDRVGAAESINTLGSSAYSQGRYADAEKLYTESLEISREIGSRFEIAGSLNSLGAVAHSQGQYGLAEKRYRESLEIQREIGDRRGIAWSLNNLGLIVNSQGRFGDAEKLHKESLEIRRDMGDRRGIAACLNSLGYVAHSQGRYADAEKLYLESLEIEREIGDLRGIAQCLNGLGQVAHSRGRFGEAEKLYGESLEIMRETGDRRGIAQCLNSLAHAAHSQGRYADAEKQHLESLEIRREMGDRRGIAECVHSLGYVAHSQGRFGEAEELYRESLDIRREIGDRSEIAESLYNLGMTQYALGDFAAARTLLTEALRITKETGNLKTGFEALVAAGGLLQKTANPEDSAVLLSGARKQAISANYYAETLFQREADAATERNRKELAPEKVAELSSRGDAMPLPELLEFAIAALEQL